MKDLFKNTVNCFFVLYIGVWVSLALTAVTTLLIRFFVGADQRFLRDLYAAIAGTVLEFSVVFSLYKTEATRYDKPKWNEYFLPTAIALLLHLALTVLFGSYSAISGVSVNAWGQIWQQQILDDPSAVTSPLDVSLWIVFLLYLLKILLLLFFTYMAYVGKKEKSKAFFPSFGEICGSCLVFLDLILHINFTLLLCTLFLILLGIFIVPYITAATAVGAVLLYILHRVILLVKRRYFLKRLQAACQTMGATFSTTGHPILNAIMCVRGGAVIEYKGETTTLFFASCLNRGVYVHVFEEGMLAFCHAIGIRLLSVIGTANLHRDEIPLFESEWRFADEIPENSYLLFSPVAVRVYSGPKGHRAVADNGTKVGRMTVYTCGAFLRDVERCLIDTHADI